MDEYLSEQEQWDRVKTWLRVNGVWIIAGIAFGALLLAGYRWWEARTDRLSLEAGTKYQEMLLALDRGDKTRAQTIVAELERDYSSSPYVDQAHLVNARVAVEAGELDKAGATLKSVMETTKDEQLALVARLRLARVQAAQSKPDEALATLNAVDAGSFKPRYQEARGDILFSKGDKSAALTEYRAARQGALTQSVDTQTLDLKIDDLVADNITPKVDATAKTEAK
ncbi:MAG: tetratricopeptide repeat protein [Gammaproteobacteria bacterium]